MNPSRRAVRFHSASLRAGLVAAGAALALAGCSATNPATVATPFNVAEGSSSQIGGERVKGSDGSWAGNGGVKFRNFLVVSQGGGAPGVVVGEIANDTPQPVTVRLSLLSQGDAQQPAQPVGTQTVTVQPGQSVQVGNVAGASGSASPSSTPAGATAPAANPYVWFQVQSVPAPPGGVVTLNAIVPSLGGTTFDVPIRPPVEYYANLTPTSASSPSGSASPTASPSGSPNPSGTAQPSPSPSS